MHMLNSIENILLLACLDAVWPSEYQRGAGRTVNW